MSAVVQARPAKAAKAAAKATGKPDKPPAGKPARDKPRLLSAGKPAQIKHAGKPSRAKPAGPSQSPATVAASAPAPAPKKPARKSIKEAAGVSTDAVARRTGKSWDDWFEVLDSAGAASLDQRGVIAILAQKHGIGPWWQQMIAVGYESLRGKSDKPPAAAPSSASSTGRASRAARPGK